MQQASRGKCPTCNFWKNVRYNNEGPENQTASYEMIHHELWDSDESRMVPCQGEGKVPLNLYSSGEG